MRVSHTSSSPLWLSLFVVFPVAVTAACDDKPPPIGEGEGKGAGGGEGEGEGEGEGQHGVVTVEVFPAGGLFCVGFCQVEEGKTFALTAVARDAGNHEIANLPITWSSVDENIATVDSSGTVTAISAGLATIEATVDGVTGQGFLDVIPPRALRVEAQPENLFLDDGGGAVLGVSVYGEDDVLLPHAAVTFTSADPGVATVDFVDGAGVVTGTGPGSTIIYVEAGFAVFDSVAVHVASTDPVPPPLAVASISAGSHHTCVVTTDGAGLCFGDNQFGQLGDGTRSEPGVPFPTPITIQGARSWSALSAGQYSSCGIEDVSGDAFCWGTNDSGQLGGDDGGLGGSPSPIPVTTGTTDIVFARLSTGGSHTCGIDVDGGAWCWGASYAGQLGTGSLANEPSPAAVAGGRTWSRIATGLASTCGLTDTGEAFCWGDGSLGTLGTGSTLFTPTTTPVAVATNERFVELALTTNHACALTADGRALCWGDASFGQLGDGTTNAPGPTPVEVDGGRTFVAIAVAAHHSCGITTNTAEVLCWGNNDFAYLGDGTLASRLEPTPIAVEDGLSFVAIDGGSNHTCALTTDDELWCWGSGSTGELGSGRPVGLGAFPVRVVAP